MTTIRSSLWTGLCTVLGAGVFSIIAPSSFSGADASASDLTLTQVIRPAQFSEAGDRLVYRYSVSNVGSTGFSNVSVVDPLFDKPVCAVKLLSPTYTAHCTAYYIVTDADVNAGLIRNTATATAANTNDIGRSNGIARKSGGGSQSATVSLRTRSVPEDAGVARLELGLSQPLTSPSQVLISTIDGSAKQGRGMDFFGFFETVTFAPGTTTASVDVQILDDTAVEGNENFTVRMFSPVGLSVAAARTPVTIRDNDTDNPVVEPSVSIFGTNVTEDGGNARVVVRLSKAAADPVIVRVATAPGTAREGEDFARVAGNITIAPGTLVRVVNIPIIDDNNVEPTESFSVSLSGPQNATLGTARATVTIADDDVVTPEEPTLSITGGSVSEDVGFANLVVRLSSASTQAVSVQVRSASESAIAGQDFRAISTTLTFSPGTTVRRIPVLITDDSVPESTEVFSASLSNPRNAKLGQRTATVTIADDDVVVPVTPTISIASVSVNEDAGQARVAVRLSEASTRRVSVRAATASGTATAGQDFTAVATTVSIAPGSVVGTFVVSIIDDNRVEPTEAFTVNLSNPINATLGARQGRVTINDDDVVVAPATLSIGDVVVGESDGVAQVPLRLSKAVAGVVTVNVASADGSATAGTDYSRFNTTVTFQPGDTRKSVNVRVINDTQTESNENFTLRLSAAVGANIADATGVVTITDDDNVVSGRITASGASVVESAGRATVTVMLTPALSTPATVNYATQAGTATAGSDFTSASGVVRFAPGETSKQIRIAILDDTAVESGESFRVAFTNATGASLATQNVRVTINDNDSGGTGIGPRPVAACLQTSATGNNQIVVSPGDDVKSKIESAPEGAEILIKAGEYRMTQQINPKNNQLLICEEGATFNGSVLLTGTWRREASSGLYFIDNAPLRDQSSGFMQPGRQINSSLNDLIIDDQVYLRVASKSEVNSNARVAKDGTLIYPGTFYQDGSRLYVATNPIGKKSEMSDVTWAFYAATGLGDNVVMENCTVEKYTGLDISAAIELKQTKGWLLRNVKARLNHTGGMHAGSSTTVLCGEYNQNGQTGISTSFAEGNGEVFSFADNLVVNGAEVAYNNWAEYNVQWHAGGMKFFLTDKVTVINSRVHDNLGVGIWSDFDVFDSVIDNNHIYNNLSRAVQIEASFKASVQRNLVQCNTLESDYSLGWNWFWGSQLFAKNSPDVEIAFNEVDVLDGQGIGIVDNNFRHRGKYDFQHALRNSVHDNVVSYADIPKPGNDGGYQYFFQRSGIESDGPATTGGDGAMNCTPDSTLSDKFTQAEITAAVAACNARGGYDATAPNANNTFFSNTYNYAEDYTHFRIRGGGYRSSNIPSPWETGSAFNIGRTAKLTNLCK